MVDKKTRSEIRLKAEVLLSLIKFNEAPVDVKRIAKFLSIPIIEYPHFSDNTSGIIVNDHDLLAIGINMHHPQVRKRFTIAHELGHFILGHDSKSFIDHSFDSSTDKEQQANIFAADLLMPIEKLKEDINSEKFSIRTLAEKYQVSEQAMSIRLVENNLIGNLKQP